MKYRASQEALDREREARRLEREQHDAEVRLLERELANRASELRLLRQSTEPRPGWSSDGGK